MSREITVIIRTKISIADRTTNLDLNRDVPEWIRDGLTNRLCDYSDAVEILAIDDPLRGSLHRQIDIHKLLNTQREIAVVWEVDDVLVLRPDLTDDQAWQVLQHAKRHHDAGIGLNWESIEAAAESIFGPEPESIAEGVTL
jgi:hypothetical protein